MDEEAYEIREALRATHLFSDVLRPDQLDALALQCSPFFLRAGSVLMRQGDLGSAMFCIVEGLVSITYVDLSGRSNLIRQLGPGSVVGEIELLTGERRIATVEAAENLRVLEIAKPALEAMFAQSPDLIESFAAILSIRQDMLQQIVPALRGSLKARLVRQIRGVFPRRAAEMDDRRS